MQAELCTLTIYGKRAQQHRQSTGGEISPVFNGSEERNATHRPIETQTRGAEQEPEVHGTEVAVGQGAGEAMGREGRRVVRLDKVRRSASHDHHSNQEHRHTCCSHYENTPEQRGQPFWDLPADKTERGERGEREGGREGGREEREREREERERGRGAREERDKVDYHRVPSTLP